MVPETFAPPFTSPRASARVVDMGDDFYVRYYVVRVSSARVRDRCHAKVTLMSRRCHDGVTPSVTLRDTECDNMTHRATERATERDTERDTCVTFA